MQHKCAPFPQFGGSLIVCLTGDCICITAHTFVARPSLASNDAGPSSVLVVCVVHHFYHQPNGAYQIHVPQRMSLITLTAMAVSWHYVRLLDCPHHTHNSCPEHPGARISGRHAVMQPHTLELGVPRNSATESCPSRRSATACCACLTSAAPPHAARVLWLWPWPGYVNTAGTLSPLWRWLQNQFDCIDMSDNNVVRLDGFPRLERLSMLIATNNRIASIAPALESAPLMLRVRPVVLRRRAPRLPQLSAPGAACRTRLV